MKTSILICLCLCTLLLSSPSTVRAGFAVEVVGNGMVILGPAGPENVPSTVVADMDGDGNLGTFAQLWNGSPSILHLETGVAESITGAVTLNQRRGWQFADVDGDGQAELLVWGNFGADPMVRTLVIGWDGINPASSPEPPAVSANQRARIAPNPAPETCTVSFTIPQAGAASVILFDVGGRQVRELLTGTYPAGNYAPKWDGLDDIGQVAPTGVYFAKITTRNGEQTAKVVLTR
jgi:hypothetical protein